MAVIFFPRLFAITINDAMFDTGPVNKNTNAAPGESPFMIKDSAIGIDEVEQMYIGKPTSTINIMDKIPLSKPYPTKKSSGIKVEIRAEIKIPMIKWNAISSKKEPKP